MSTAKNRVSTQNSSKKQSKSAGYLAGILFLPCALLMLLSIYAQKYSVVRSGLFMGTPDDFLWIALPLAIACIFSLWRVPKAYFQEHKPPASVPSYVNFMSGLVVVIMLPVCSGFFASILLILNGALDDAIPTFHETSLVYKRMTTGKGGPSYSFRFTDWRDGKTRWNVNVSDDFYDSKPVGAPLAFTTKPGALGYEWIVNIE